MQLWWKNSGGHLWNVRSQLRRRQHNRPRRRAEAARGHTLSGGTHAAETTSKVAGYLIGYAKKVIPKSALPGMTRLFDSGTNASERLLGWRQKDDHLLPPLRIRLHIGPFLDP